MIRVLLLIAAALLLACAPSTNSISIQHDVVLNQNNDSISILAPFTRTTIKQQLLQKIKNNQPLIIHAFVPLCDNDNQGIVPVNKALGDGDNLTTNLYWGALYGVKTHFSRKKRWTKAYDQKHNDSFLLERVVFKRTYSNGAKVIFITDAYNGNAMEKCLNHYLQSLSGMRSDSIQLDSSWIEISKQADLVVFNGHNGLMDVEVPISTSTLTKKKDAIAIACISKPYFKDYLIQSQGYPLLMTKHLLAPEAYVLSAIIDAWALQKPEQEVWLAAATAYNQYQKCGIKGAKNLFSTGW
jgi:hypothetical protein